MREFMSIKENVFKLMLVFVIVTFVGVLFFTITFLKVEINKATNPSAEVTKSGGVDFNQKAFDAVLKKVQ